MSAPGRPRRITEDCRTYNALYPIALLDKVKEEALKQDVSGPVIMRMALEEYFDKDKPAPYPSADTYSDGVMDACEAMRKSGRLKGKISTGQTVGEIIAAQILSELT